MGTIHLVEAFSKNILSGRAMDEWTHEPKQINQFIGGFALL
jgi:hypothetical protein